MAAGTEISLNALLPAVSMAGFAVQQFIQVVIDPFVTYWIRTRIENARPAGDPPQKRVWGVFVEAEAKQIVLGLFAWVMGMLIAGFGGALVLHSVYPSVNLVFDVLVSGLTISAGTEGVNSVLKFIQYAKDAKKLVSLPALGGASPDSAVTPLAFNPQNFVANNLYANSGNGPVLTNANLQLLFWGSSWNAGANPSVTEITDAVNKIITGSYMSELDQYDNVKNAQLKGDPIPEPSDPPNVFSDDDIVTLLKRLLDSPGFPQPDDNQLVYCVFMPPQTKSDSGFAGEHSTFVDRLNRTVRYCWVTNPGTLDAITPLFSHELVEVCTDPDFNAWQGVVNFCGQPGACEIADIGGNSTIDRIAVKSYWSNRRGGFFP